MHDMLNAPSENLLRWDEWRIAMAQNVWMPTPTPSPVRRGGRGWLHALWIGVVLFIATTIVMFLTGNPNLYPTVILIGNFLVPVVFVAFLYDHQHLSTLTPETVATSFCVGGVLGVLEHQCSSRWCFPWQPIPIKVCRWVEG